MLPNYNVIPIPSSQTYDWLLNKHYAGSVPAIMYSFGIYLDQEMVGVCCYGTPANNHNNMLGDFKCIELVRLVINDNSPKNSLSYFVAQTFKYLPSPLAIISYADQGVNHHGYIYQATNWIYTGLGGGVDFYRDKSGRMIHSRIMSDYRLKWPDKSRAEIAEYLHWETEKGSYKYRYYYFLGNKKEKRQMLATLKEKYKILPYPKGENDRYDASYKTSTQTTMF